MNMVQLSLRAVARKRSLQRDTYKKEQYGHIPKILEGETGRSVAAHLSEPTNSLLPHSLCFAKCPFDETHPIATGTSRCSSLIQDQGSSSRLSTTRETKRTGQRFCVSPPLLRSGWHF